MLHSHARRVALTGLPALLLLLIGQVGSATPISRTNLVLHLNAVNTGSFTFNGSDVAQWNDQSSSLNHGSQAAPADQPEYVAAGLNGKPVVRFDGASEYLELATTTNLFGGFEIFIVASNVSDGDPLSNGWQFSSPGGGFRVNAVASGSLQLQVGSQGTPVTAPVVTPYQSIIGVTYADAGDDYQLRRTGGLVDSVTSSFEYNSNAATGSRVGASNNNSGGIIRFFDGDIGEIAVYDSPLSPSERQLIEGQLAWNWGLQGQLPLSHPFRFNSPFVAVPEPSSLALVGPALLALCRFRRRK